MKTLLVAACFAFLLLNAAESRRCNCDDDDDSEQSSYKLFVFGDSYADTGNLLDGDLNWGTRSWHEPFGMSDADHDNKPTGRCSDGLVQSDFLAKILGLDDAPTPQRMRRNEGVDLSSGINFASGGGALVGWNLDTQIDELRKLVRHGIIDKNLTKSVALVAVSDGSDYADFPAEQADQDRLIRNVTDAIVDGVRQLEDLGVDSVLVDLMPPIGCNPWNTRMYNYTKCDDEKNRITSAHNKHLKEKLDDDDSVLLLDLEKVFNKIVIPKTERLFQHRHVPCCETMEMYDGFCGQLDGDGNRNYTLCDKPDDYFFWDDSNPTQAGWKVVMGQLEGQIKDFLDI
ncbi:hypothetical protein HU200_054736 [Digitaria exilis]|uniref:Uncharacterized protein n=1 Tax=Digitaria exilis TaxID=1010633 RepID=A0A835E6U9_9POAL|nr:hypothetical protein HU200_054736 [Digitaria exilis]